MTGKADVAAADGGSPDFSEADEEIGEPDAEPNVEMGTRAEAPPKVAPWPTFLQKAKDPEIKDRFAREISGILAEHGMEKYCVLALVEPEDSIDATDLDRVFAGLSELNRDRNKDVLLLLLARGGSIEPAYQISKLCKSFASSRFLAIVPRQAKSAATLIALGADEIHMGPLAQLGPIDPQLGGLPALGVSQALKTIASVAQEYPGSADMFARYLRMVLTVEQIGYCDRISESAVQYAVRLLSTKSNLPKAPAEVAKELVHEYKDHGFVIDIDEARMHLGSDWIKTGTPELAAAEQIYNHFDMVNFFLRWACSKRLIITGGASASESILIFKIKK